LAEQVDINKLKALRRANDGEYAACRSLFGQRLAQGFVRECHGDLHLGNIVVLDGKPHFRWHRVQCCAALDRRDKRSGFLQ